MPDRSSTTSLRRLTALQAAVLCAALIGPAGRAADAQPAADSIAAGRHLVLTGHCNNCHTARYAERAGAIPEDQTLMGNPVGWRSRAGTVYASNLRLVMQALSEDDWLRVARQAQWRAPMPWWSIREYDDDELRAIYRYVRSLSPLGTPAPAYAPAGQAPAGPVNLLPDCGGADACR